MALSRSDLSKKTLALLNSVQTTSSNCSFIFRYTFQRTGLITIILLAVPFVIFRFRCVLMHKNFQNSQVTKRKVQLNTWRRAPRLTRQLAAPMAAAAGRTAPAVQRAHVYGAWAGNLQRPKPALGLREPRGRPSAVPMAATARPPVPAGQIAHAFGAGAWQRLRPREGVQKIRRNALH